jgi:hypothetical protein
MMFENKVQISMFEHKTGEMMRLDYIQKSLIILALYHTLRGWWDQGMVEV